VDQSQIDALLRQGIAAAKAGQTEQARQILLRVIELDETNVQGWLWLSSVVDDPADKFTCLHNVLALDPDNQSAQLGLARLDRSSSLSDPQTPNTHLSSSVSPDESATSPGEGAGTTRPKPARRVSRYKRLSSRSISKKSSATSSPPEQFDSDSAEAPGLSCSQIPANISDTTKEMRHKRSSSDSVESMSSHQKPRHLEEYASMASALIQKKSGPTGEDAGEVPERRGSARCPFCRSPISVMAVECDHCHLPLVVDCPACDTRIDVELSACPSCGRPMGAFRDKTVYFANLAAAYQSQGKNHNAVVAWGAVQLLNRDYPDLYLQLARAQAGADRPQKAIQTLRSVLEVEPGQEAASLALGEIYHNLSYWDEAEEIYREALAVSPDSAALNFALGWLLVDYGQVEQGLLYVCRATELDPEHGMAWFRLGQIYDVLHKPKKATESYRWAVVYLPKETLAYQKAMHKLSVLEPELPQALSTGWSEFVRQVAGPFLVCVVAVFLDSGMRPWWIPLPGWGALLVGFIGAILWVSGMSLPRNPVICWLVGKQGLTDTGSRVFAILIGSFFWLLAMGIILYPINQSIPEVPEWILNS